MRSIEKILLLAVLVTVVSCSFVESINQGQLDDIKKGKKVWLVYSGKGIHKLIQIFLTATHKFSTT
jgi:hypothetical protein